MSYMQLTVQGVPIQRPRNLKRLPAGGFVWTERFTTQGGAIVERTIAVTDLRTVGRETCYCCSCYEDPEYGTRVGSDPFCRNHGSAGTRRCDAHNMPGDRYANELHDELTGKVDLTKVRLMSVQEKRAAEREGDV